MTDRSVITISTALVFSAFISFTSLSRNAGADEKTPEAKMQANRDAYGDGVSSVDDFGESASLDDYVRYAERNNPALEAAFYRWQASLETAKYKRSLPDPRISYSYYIENVETRVGPQRHALNISQTFPWYGTRDLRSDIASGETAALAGKYDALRRSVVFDVKRAYIEYYYIGRARHITDENLRYLANIGEAIRSRYIVGKAAYADLLRIQVEIAKTEERLLSLNDLVNPLKADLNAALNRPADAPLPEPKTLPDLTGLPADEKLHRLLSENNPEIGEITALIGKESKSVALAGKKFYPDITLGINYIETGTSSMPNIADSGKDAILGMVSINIPLWRNAYKSSVNEAEIRRRSLEKSRTAHKNTLSATLERAIYEVRDSKRKIDLYTEILIPRTREALGISLDQYKNGTGTYIDIIDSQRTLLEMELSLERAMSDRAIHYAEIERIAGNISGEESQANLSQPERE